MSKLVCFKFLQLFSMLKILVCWFASEYVKPEKNFRLYFLDCLKVVYTTAKIFHVFNFNLFSTFSCNDPENNNTARKIMVKDLKRTVLRDFVLRKGITNIPLTHLKWDLSRKRRCSKNYRNAKSKLECSLKHSSRLAVSLNWMLLTRRQFSFK